MNRRSLILGSICLLAAPAIVRAESLMKIVVPTLRSDVMLSDLIRAKERALQEYLAQSVEDMWFYGATFTEFTVDGPRRIDPRKIIFTPPGGLNLA